jgi:hypothetical protein
MPAAGETIIAGRVPGERIATTTATADSSTFTTTETTVMSVTAALVTGRTYRVRFYGRFNSSVSTDRVVARFREDNSSGTEIATTDTPLTNYSGTFGHAIEIEIEYTASATGNKTFVVTGERGAGSGNCNLEAATTRPAYLYVDYIRG